MASDGLGRAAWLASSTSRTPFPAITAQVVAGSHLQLDWGLLAEEPDSTGDERWDVFPAALAEHLAAQEGCVAAVVGKSRGCCVASLPSGGHGCVHQECWHTLRSRRPVVRESALVIVGAVQPVRTIRAVGWEVRNRRSDK